MSDNNNSSKPLLENRNMPTVNTKPDLPKVQLPKSDSKD